MVRTSSFLREKDSLGVSALLIVFGKSFNFLETHLFICERLVITILVFTSWEGVHIK